MSRRPHLLAWAPPFLVGASAAIAAEVGVSLLLYTGPGFVRSLTVVLAVSGAALAGGLWSAPAPGPDFTERLRRRWLLALLAFLAASAYGVAWTLVSAVGEWRWGQGLGLAILAGLPLYASGAVLGGIAGVSPTRLRGVRTGAAAALGAGLGFVLTGLLLPRTPVPATLLVACLVLLSLGGMIFGFVLGEVLEIDVLGERASRTGPVRVEDRFLTAKGIAERVLLEDRHERRRQALGEDDGLSWDVSVARALMPDDGRPWSVLCVGGGASPLARHVLDEYPAGSVEVLERNGEVVALGREFLETGLEAGTSGRVTVRVGNLEDLVKDVRGLFDVVVVDALALSALGGAPGLSREARGRLVQAVSGSGVLVWGPHPPAPGMPELAEGWPRAVFDREIHGGTERVSVLGSRVGGGESVSVEGFALRNGEPPDT